VARLRGKIFISYFSVVGVRSVFAFSENSSSYRRRLNRSRFSFSGSFLDIFPVLRTCPITLRRTRFVYDVGTFSTPVVRPAVLTFRVRRETGFSVVFV